DAIGQQAEADDHLKGARPEQQPDARSGQHADAQRQYQFHQAASFPASAASCARMRLERSDWCAMAIRIRIVAPSTTAKTPASNSSAVAAGTGPMNGRSTYCACAVRNG